MNSGRRLSLQNQSTEGYREFDGREGSQSRTHYSSQFGTSASTDTDAVSKIFAAGGYNSQSLGRKIGFGLGLVLLAVVCVWALGESSRSPNVPTVSSSSTYRPDIGANGSRLITQSDLAIECELLETANADGSSRYGCNAVLQNGEYHGVIIGWWQVIDAIGERIPFVELDFKADGYDALIVLSSRQALEDIRFVPWLR